MNMLDRHPLDQSLKELADHGKFVEAVARTQRGYVILWCDSKGHTVTECTSHGFGTGGARSQEDATQEFIDKLAWIGFPTA